MSAVDILLTRLTREEGNRIYPYDDATGERVRAPKGHITWGRGFNLDECGSPELFDVMERFFLMKLDKDMQAYPWYVALDPVRASVILDVEYNGGEAGFLKGFPHCIAALERGDLASAATELHVEDPRLDASRYAPLRSILLTGMTP